MTSLTDTILNQHAENAELKRQNIVLRNAIINEIEYLLGYEGNSEEDERRLKLTAALLEA